MLNCSTFNNYEYTKRTYNYIIIGMCIRVSLYMYSSLTIKCWLWTPFYPLNN